jgi:YfiH family protein
VTIVEQAARVAELESLGLVAFTTTRAIGSFGTASREPVQDVMDRWNALRKALSPHGPRFATASQVHGATLVVHGDEWEGWLRRDAADGHIAVRPGTALAVTIADCVPVFIAHPGGTVSLLHAGWRGTAAGILPGAIAGLARLGLPANELRVHLGPSICGPCYEVGPEVAEALTGKNPGRKTHVDVRAVLADQARVAGVHEVSISPHCTRCHNDRFFSHRAGDPGRQVAVIVAPA